MTATMIELDDGTRLRTWTTGVEDPHRLPVIMMHGGPGVADYLEPVADLIDDLCPVHRYDQRGTGGSTWNGEHTISRQVDDLAQLMDQWGHERAVLVGHSFGTNLTSYFLLAHPTRVAGLVQLAGPFLNPWREADRTTQRARRTERQQARLDELGEVDPRTDEDEIEFLTLSWFTDHADQQRAWAWAATSAREQRPINYAMNTQLNALKKTDPLESHLDELRHHLPPGTVIIGGAGDSRPAAALRRLAGQLDCEVVIIPDAGHDPWLEAPEEFRAVFRSAVDFQTRPGS